MPKFRKKPIVIEAVQFTSANVDEVSHFTGIPIATFGDIDREYRSVPIQTLEGTMLAIEGDWIIKGIQGEFYPCKPDIFEATYDAV